MVKDPSSSVRRGGDSMSAILILELDVSLIHEGLLQGLLSELSSKNRQEGRRMREMGQQEDHNNDEFVES